MARHATTAAGWALTALLIWSSGCVPAPVYRSGAEAPVSGGPAPSRSSPTATAERTRRTPPPEVVTPAQNAHPVDPGTISTAKAYQIGVASYYGEKFHGRKTANGEVFNMYKLTAAHRVLPLGTIAKVTNLENGRWVVVKVNDRGPFIEGRILDLSFAAALELEMVKQGTAKVMIEIVDPVD